jgi:hypothetical protein
MRTTFPSTQRRIRCRNSPGATGGDLGRRRVGTTCHTDVTAAGPGRNVLGNEVSQTVGMPPLDRRAAEGLLFLIPVPMAGGALLASGATVLAVLVLCAGVVIAFFGSLRLWRTRPR